MKSNFNRLLHFTHDYQKKEAIILRDHLSIERTKLASERTLLSYVRTSLYLTLGGIAFLQMQNLEELKILGYFFIALSIIILIIGIIRFFQLKKHLRKMYEPLEENSIEERTEKQ